MRILQKEGYPTYAKLLNLFTLYLSDDPAVSAYVVPDRGKIVMNKYFDDSQVSTIIRHEILHEWLKHNERFMELLKSDPTLINAHEPMNYAADYEISNRGYTDRDKNIVRNLKIGDKITSGLVTEDGHPEWVNLTFEEMYRELVKEMKDNPPPPPQGPNGSGGEPNDNSNQGEDNNNGSSDGTAEIPTDQQGDGTDGTPSDQQSGGKNRGLFGNRDKDDKDEEELTDEIRRNIDEIKRALEDPSTLDQLDRENINALQKEVAAKALKQQQVKKLITENPLENFEISLQRFIKLQTSAKRMRVEDEIHPSYAYSGYFVPRTKKVISKNIPLINVYWDVSGSFSDPRKTKGAEKAIATIAKYEKKNLIKTHTYFFADKVTNDRDSAGGGTRGKPIQENIEQTHPTNVIIITDDDITDCRGITRVPGAVWMLFYDKASDNLMHSIEGKMENKYYLITDYLGEGLDKKQKKYVIKGKSGRILSSESLNESVLRDRLPGLRRIVKEDIDVVEVDGEGVDVNTDLVPESPAEGPSLGISDLLISAINDEWETIRKYNELIVNAQYNHFDDMVPVIQDIVSEENVHVGQLQKLMETISSNTEDIAKGEAEADEQLSNPVETE